MAFKFEKLKIWQTAPELAGEISHMVKPFAKGELFILTFQIKRAADSVVLTITEGSALHSNTAFKRFLVFANRSAPGFIGCLYPAKQRPYITEKIFKDKYFKYEKLTAMIQALIKSLGNE